MYNTVAEIAQRVLELMQEGTGQLSRSSSRLSYDLVVKNINSVYERMNREGQMARRQELITYQIGTRNSTTKELDIRWNPRRKTLYGVSATDSASAAPVDPEELAMLHRPHEGDRNQKYPSYRLTNGRISIPEGFSTYYRVWYIRTPGSLHQGTASAGTANSITFPSSPTYGAIDAAEDAYNQDLVSISSGTGANQMARITDYAASTRVATCENVDSSGNAFGTVPRTDSVYSILPWFPRDFYECLALGAAAMFTKRSTAKELMLPAERAMHEFRQWCSMDDRVSPINVVNLGRVNNGLMGHISGSRYVTWPTS